MRVELPRRPLEPVTFLPSVALIAASMFGSRALAQTPAPPAPHTTIVIVADHPMQNGEWLALFDDLRNGLKSDPEAPPELADGVELIRGDEPAPNLSAGSTIKVTLHGDCALLPHPRIVVEGPIGWVPRIRGHIQPVVHVDCVRIVQMLAPMALAMNIDRRNTVMGEAMERVILHELIHIASQSSAHASHGVAQAQFDVADLLAEDSQYRRRDSKKRTIR